MCIDGRLPSVIYNGTGLHLETQLFLEKVIMISEKKNLRGTLTA